MNKEEKKARSTFCKKFEVLQVSSVPNAIESMKNLRPTVCDFVVYKDEKIDL